MSVNSNVFEKKKNGNDTVKRVYRKDQVEGISSETLNNSREMRKKNKVEDCQKEDNITFTVPLVISSKSSLPEGKQQLLLA